MPRAKASVAAARKPTEPEKPAEPKNPVEPEEQVDLDGDNDPEEMTDEEVEYEEVEEEVEEEEEEEEPEEEEPEEAMDADGAETQGEASDEDEMKTATDEDGDESKKHAELLALPPQGSEVYIGSIPQDTSEEELRNFCEDVGEVTEVRIMKGKDSAENKGYAFVTFRTKELAAKAIEDLNGTELKGKKVKCSSSQAKYRLFIGNIPREWAKEDLNEIVTKVGPGVVNVEWVKDPQNPGRNRGFAFIEYYNHACAEYSRQKMSNSEFKLDMNSPTVSWADSKNSESVANTSQVKALYVKNLPKDVTQDKLKELFKHHGEITKVVLPPAKSGQEKSRFGFVHFAERSSAMKALKNTETYKMDGQILECSLAKPQTDRKSDAGSNMPKSSLLSSYPPRMGYGLVGGAYGGGAYGGMTAGYGAAGYGQSAAAGYGQPIIYGRGPTPAGMAMTPMLLPDGRIGYVLQQPGAHPYSPPPPQHKSGGNRSGGSGSGGDRRNGDRRSGGSSSGGKRGGDSGRGRRYNPY